MLEFDQSLWAECQQICRGDLVHELDSLLMCYGVYFKLVREGRQPTAENDQHLLAIERRLRQIVQEHRQETNRNRHTEQQDNAR